MITFEKETCTANQCINLGKAVIETETQAIQALATRIDEKFAKACATLLQCEGRIVVIGMGKSGHIGNKIAATLASTGTPAFFVHPGEANHGDMGMVTQRDVVLALSYSGETHEVLTLLPFIKRFGIPLVALTGKPQSTLAKTADVNLDVSVSKEACPLGLAPTASTTVMLVMGDALAIALLETRGFTPNDFAMFHPGGSLGKRLLLRIDDLMHTDTQIPKVNENCLLNQALVEMTQKRLGMTTVVDNQGKLRGIFTDGDLRRALDQNRDIHKTPIKEVMTEDCKTIAPGALAAVALKLMQENKITALLVTNESKIPLGVLHLHDLLKAGVT